jgi:hypothetical protein
VSPSDLSKRLAALDWSGVGLEHQLAISAAALALEGADGVLELPAFLPPRGPRKYLKLVVDSPH